MSRTKNIKKTITINNKLKDFIEVEGDKKIDDFLDTKFVLPNPLSIVQAYEIEPNNYENCEILFLGTVPSKQGKKENFYYFSKRNYFYDFVNEAIKPKYNLLEKGNKKQVQEQLPLCKISICDVIYKCIRLSGLDTGIFAYQLRTEKQIKDILNNSNINTVFCTSQDTAMHLKESLGDSYICDDPKLGGKISVDSKTVYVVVLPSPSPTRLKNKEDVDKAKAEWVTQIRKALSIN